MQEAFNPGEHLEKGRNYGTLLDEGGIIKRAFDESNRVKANQLSYSRNFEGLNAVVMNAKGSSKTMESKYGEAHDLMVLFSWNGKVWTVSLYSDREHVHCGELAKSIADTLGTGGGGHKGAAGFQASTEDLESLGLL